MPDALKRRTLGLAAAGVGSVPDFIENHKAGKIRMVAVIGDKRQATLPEVRERAYSATWARMIRASGFQAQ